MDDLVTKAKERINDILYLSLATVSSEANPHNSPVYTAFDTQYNFYWVSCVGSQHSKNIRHNSKSFVVIYDSTVKHGKGFGVYFCGSTYELGSEDVDSIVVGIDLLSKRINTSTESANNYLGDRPKLVYKFVPTTAWVNTFTIVDNQILDTKVDITKHLLHGVPTEQVMI
jgi:hypothetical protein